LSLKSFHIFFIAVCAGLSLFMILWGVEQYRLSASPLGLGSAIVGAATLLILIPYSRWVRRKFQKINAFAFLTISISAWLHAETAQACSVCFGDPNSVMSKGIKAGVVLLILIVGGVLGGIASVAVSWARRAKALEQ
jgi:hypothetical protein